MSAIETVNNQRKGAVMKAKCKDGGPCQGSHPTICEDHGCAMEKKRYALGGYTLPVRVRLLSTPYEVVDFKGTVIKRFRSKSQAYALMNRLNGGR